MVDVDQASAGPSSSGAVPAVRVNPIVKRMERLERLKQLHTKRAEGSRVNHQEVVEEYKRNALPKNWIKKREWADKKLEEVDQREKARAEGKDYERLQMLEVQADEAEKWEAIKRRKKNPDEGFSTWEAATARQYNRNVKALKPDMEFYERLKEEMGEELFYANQDTIIQNLRKDNKEDVDRMVEDLNKQIEKRGKRIRRRTFDDEADVDYINERNMRFNQQIERFYGKYTTEIKQNLERGTAV